MSTIATDGKLTTRLVVHDSQYAGQVYELQVMSHGGTWVVATSAVTMRDIGSWANRHCYPLPDQTTPCGSCHSDGETETRERFDRVDADLGEMDMETFMKVKYFITGAMVAGAKTQTICDWVNNILGVKVCYDTVEDLIAIVSMDVK